MHRIIKASIEHLPQISNLFNKYRMFYRQPDDLVSATKFIESRLINQDSAIFLALEQMESSEREIGFTQLFPSFTSVGLSKIFVLNDLYVEEEFRGKGVAASLVNHSHQFARDNDASRVDLKTAYDNPAQELYRKLGYVQDTRFLHFSYSIERERAPIIQASSPANSLTRYLVEKRPTSKIGALIQEILKTKENSNEHAL